MLIKVYCKKNFSDYKYNRHFIKYKTYYIFDEKLPVSVSVFVYYEDKQTGLWFNVENFNDIFTFNNDFIREKKLKRIL